jgi:Domain of unkown function (DUF1775)
VKTAPVLLAALCALAFPNAAAAHVEVLPDTVAPGADQELTIEVPNERDLATTRVSVTFPRGLSVYSLGRSAGWRQRPVLSADGRLHGVVYSGGRIAPRHYETFHVLAVGTRPGVFAWSVRQAYADGKVKPWTGTPERDSASEAPESGPTQPGPAPATRVAPPAAAAGNGTSPAVASAQKPAAAPARASAKRSSPAAVWLGVIAIVLASAAVLLVGLLWSTRPARLPADPADEVIAELDRAWASTSDRSA